MAASFLGHGLNHAQNNVYKVLLLKLFIWVAFRRLLSQMHRNNIDLLHFQP